MVICGDAAGMVNVDTKGIHYAMHSGMYAAEAIVESLKQDSVNFENYERRVKDSIIERTCGSRETCASRSRRA